MGLPKILSHYLLFSNGVFGMRRMIIVAMTCCLAAVKSGRADDPSQSSGTPALTKPSQVDTEFKALKKAAETKLNKLYATVAREYGEAKTEEAREEIKKRGLEEAAKIYLPAVEKLMPLIRQNPADPGAVEALVWVVNARSGSGPGNEAAEYLRKYHPVNQQTIELAYRHRRAPMAWTEPLLRAQLGAPETPAAQRPRVLLALAMVKQTLAQFPEMLGQMTDDQVSQMNEIYGKERVAEFRKIDAGREEAEAIKLFSELAERHGAEKLVSNLTYGGVSRGSIFEIKHLAAGKPAPEISGEDTEGTKFNLSDYKGKVVLLSFWGTWCGPCMALVPHEREIVERLKNKKFALIGVNSDVDKSKLQAAQERERITWRSFWCGDKGPEGEIPSAWNVTGWPTIYVLDHKGIIRGKQAMGKALDQLVDKLVAEADAAVDR
jgi:thiol-disulfide isomerase/thioredoxin